MDIDNRRDASIMAATPQTLCRIEADYFPLEKL